MPGMKKAAEKSLAEITEAAEALLLARGQSAPTRKRAVDALYRASSQSDSGVRYFSAPGKPASAETANWDELINAAALEMQSAHILATASIAAGETKLADNSPVLGSLDDAVAGARTILSGSPNKQFFGKVTRGEPSANVADAVVKLRAAARETIDSVLKDSEAAVSRSLEVIKEKQKSVLEAFGYVSQFSSAAAQLEGLMKKAWEKLQSAIGFLSKILNDLPPELVEQQMARFSAALSLRHILELAYQTEPARSLVDQMRVRADLDQNAIDHSRDQVVQIRRDFASFTKTAMMVSGLASMLAGAIAAHFAGPLGAAATPAVHALIIAVVLAFGMASNNAWITVPYINGIRSSLGAIAASAQTA